MDAAQLRKGMSPAEIGAFVGSVLGQLSLREKAAQMTGSVSLLTLAADTYLFRHYNRTAYPAGGVPRFGIPPVLFSDGPRGVVMGHATCFPVSMARGASWDPELEERIGEAIGREVRALGGNFFGGVCINLLRHPAWGRAQETYGEDPFHLAAMGTALLRGVQRHNVMACAKHFACNSIENARHRVDVRADERTLREVYLPAFRACVEAGVASVMGAYNKLRGQYCCESPYLLTQVLRKDWGFEGFVVSDFVFALRDTVAAASAGLDLEMPSPRFYGSRLVEAVRSGRVPEAAVDAAVRRILGTVVRFASAEDPQAYPPALVCSREHVELAREAAEKGIVLLKNEGALLPFDRSRVRKLAVLGRLAEEENIGDHGSSRVRPPYTVTPAAGLRDYLGRGAQVRGAQVRGAQVRGAQVRGAQVRGAQVRGAQVGGALVRGADGYDLDRAQELASWADAVVVVAGYDHRDEGEKIEGRGRVGGDRANFSLHPQEVELIRRAADANRACVVVLVGGSAILMEEWRQAVPAILVAWYGGMEGGTALARILFGETSPGGKLPFSIPRSPEDLPFFDPNADAIEYGYYHGYTLLEKKGVPPAFPFGFGLSYTSFACGPPTVETRSDGVRVSVEIANTGPRAGEEVVQLYVGPKQSAVEWPAARTRAAGPRAADRPDKLLRGFRRVRLEPGERRGLSFEVPYDDLAWYDPERSAWTIEQTDYVVHVGTSPRAADLLRAEFRPWG